MISNEQYFRGEATAYATYKMSLKLGWQCLYEISFEDYRDKNNEVIIKTQPPNTHLRLLIFKRKNF